MLDKLYIKNFAIIDEEEIHFSEGLNIITGETGAGKSIIFDALMSTLGNRVSANSIRKGREKAVIESTFSNNNYNFQELNEMVTEYSLNDEELCFRREINLNGRSRAFLNDTLISINDLSKVSNLILDYHGQNQHQLLLSNENHINYYDMYLGVDEKITAFKRQKLELSKLVNKLDETIRRENELKEKYDYLKFKLNEIDEVSPKKGEDVKVNDELKIVENSEQIFNLSNESIKLLYDNAESAYNNLALVIKNFEGLGSFDNSMEEYVGELNTAMISSKEISGFLKDYISNIDFSQSRIDKLRNRSRELRKLEKKYGSLEKAIETKEEIEAELNLTENFDYEIGRLKKEIEEKQRVVGISANELSKIREEKCKVFSDEIVDKLKFIGIEHGQFEIRLERVLSKNNFSALVDGKNYQLFENGIDRLEFFVSTNKGERPKPLSETASGGEISRIMLVIKSILSGKDKTGTLIFDEIDVGISGKIAQKVGTQIKHLAKYHQIISITHLPQIAAAADWHFSVEKIENDGGTFTGVRKLSDEERVNEIAKLLSGEQVNENALNNAKQLIEEVS